MPARAQNTGFTLIEVLVAISILAIALTVILQLFSGGLRSNRLAEDYNRAVFHARQKMEEVLLLDEPEPGSTEGEFEDGYRWQAEIARVEADEDVDERLPVETFAIKVAIQWGAGENRRDFAVNTLKIVEKSELES